MPSGNSELEKRRKAALAAIRGRIGTAEDEYGATLFVSHHLAEIEHDYWQRHLGIAQPDPLRVLDLLVLVDPSDDDEEDLDSLDFTLPDDVTNYVLCVSFDDEGQVTEVSMES
jgi:Protein of unknown function (DUF2004)